MASSEISAQHGPGNGSFPVVEARSSNSTYTKAHVLPKFLTYWLLWASLLASQIFRTKKILREAQAFVSPILLLYNPGLLPYPLTGLESEASREGWVLLGISKQGIYGLGQQTILPTLFMTVLDIC